MKQNRKEIIDRNSLAHSSGSRCVLFVCFFPSSVVSVSLLVSWLAPLPIFVCVVEPRLHSAIFVGAAVSITGETVAHQSPHLLNIYNKTIYNISCRPMCCSSPGPHPGAHLRTHPLHTHTVHPFVRSFVSSIRKSHV